MSWNEISKRIRDENPDIVGISSLFSPYHREAIKVAEIVKRETNAVVIMGGSHVSATPELVLKNENVDFIVIGEGEKPLVELLTAFIDNKSYETIGNLGFKKAGHLIINPRGENFAIEDLAAPDLSDFSLKDYSFEGRPMTFMITSRSCPHRCSFCSVHATFGGNYRRRSVENVMSEIHQRYRQGFRVIDFEDDNLTFYVREMKELCLRLIKEFPQRDLELVAMNGISYLSLNRELLQLMKDAGFSRLNLALVSSDESVLSSTKRPHTVSKYIEIVETAHSLGFKMTSYQILGLPFETLESMMQTMAFNAGLPVLMGASMFYMTPNSPIAIARKHSLSEENIFLSRLTAMAIETENFKREDIYTLFIATRIINYLKGDMRNPDHDAMVKHLFSHGEMLAKTSQGFLPLSKFKADLFFELWKRIPTITKQTGEVIAANAQTFLDNGLQEIVPTQDDLKHDLHVGSARPASLTDVVI